MTILTTPITISSVLLLASGATVFVHGEPRGDSQTAKESEARCKQLVELFDRQLSKGQIAESSKTADEIEQLSRGIAKSDRGDFNTWRRMNVELKRLLTLDSKSQNRAADALKKAYGARRDYENGKKAAAAIALSESLEEIKPALGDRSFILAVGLRMPLVDCYRELGMYDLALPQVDAASAEEADRSAEDVHCARILTQKGLVHVGLKEYDKAEMPLRKALAIWRKLDKHGRDCLLSQVHLAGVNLRLNRHEEARALLVDALRRGDVDGLTGTDYALALFYLGCVEAEFGDTKGAMERWVNATLAISEAKTGDSLCDADILERLSAINLKLGNVNAAGNWGAKELEIRERIAADAKTVRESMNRKE